MVSQLRRTILGVILLALVALTYIRGEVRNLDQVVPERYRIYGIPITVSEMLFGLEGYVAYQSIARRFVNDKPIDVILSQDLPRNSHGVPEIPTVERDEGLFFVPADDKGEVTFTRMAFWLFGMNLKSLYRMFFALMLVSVIAYVVTFYGDQDKLLIGCCLLLALLSFPRAFQDGVLLPFVGTFYDPRIFGVGAVLAVLHLGFISLEYHRISFPRLVCAIYQAFMVVFAVHVRSAALWLVCALLAWVGLVVCRRVIASADRGSFWARLTRAMSLVPFVLLGVGFAVLLIGERVKYDRRYFTSHMAHHLFWHNAALGFALHPQLGEPYDYISLDEHMMKRVAGYLLTRGDREALTRIFGGAYTNSTGTVHGVQINVGMFLHSATSDFALYNDVARQIVVETVRAHPWQTAALFGYYKPTYLFSFLAWLTTDRPTVDASGHQILRRKGAVFNPVEWAAIGLLLLALAVGRQGPSSLSSGLLPAASLLLFSLMPQMITYPGNALMGESLFALSFVAYLAIAVGLTEVPPMWRPALPDVVVR